MTETQFQTIFTLDEQTAEELYIVARRAYRAEASVIDVESNPILRESLDAMRSVHVTWTIAWRDSGIVGAIAWNLTSREMDINRLIVDPSVSREGIGRRLVELAVGFSDGRPVRVATDPRNERARRLYESLGFVYAGDKEVIPGYWGDAFELPARE